MNMFEAMISQCIHIPKHQDVHLEYITFVNFIAIKDKIEQKKSQLLPGKLYSNDNIISPSSTVGVWVLKLPHDKNIYTWRSKSYERSGRGGCNQWPQEIFYLFMFLLFLNNFYWFYIGRERGERDRKNYWLAGSCTPQLGIKPATGECALKWTF